MTQDVILLLLAALLIGAGAGVALGAALFRRQVRDAIVPDPAPQSRGGGDKKMNDVLNAIPVALIQTDREGRFVFANRAAHTLLGRRESEVVGQKLHSATWAVTQPDGRPVPLDLLPTARALRGQTIKAFPHTILNAQTRRPMLVATTATPIMDDNHQVVGATAAMVQIEDLTTPQVEPASAADDGLTRRVFDAASSALVVLDLDGRVLDANVTARQLTQGGGDPVGRDFADAFLLADERSQGRQAVRAALAAPEGEAESIQSEAGTGGVSWALLPLPADGDAPAAVLLAGERRADGDD